MNKTADEGKSETLTEIWERLAHMSKDELDRLAREGNNFHHSVAIRLEIDPNQAPESIEEEFRQRLIAILGSTSGEEDQWLQIERHDKRYNAANVLGGENACKLMVLCIAKARVIAFNNSEGQKSSDSC